MEKTLINRYGTLAAWVYQLDKPVGRCFGDVAFYRARLAGVTGPILEPAAGNGRVLIPLVEAGLDVWGCDASPEMLRLCEAACRARGLAPPLSQQRFEDFAYDVRFDAVIVPAGSFQLITDAGLACAVLRRFHGALRPGGRLILDLDRSDSLAGSAPRLRHWRDGADVLTLHEIPVGTDVFAQTAETGLRYEHWRDGRLTAAAMELFRLRWWGLLEIDLAVRAAGFADVTVAADYRSGTAPGPDTQILTVEARAA
ncbi:class I SAM-dependent methyltransferase [Roseospira goensis]|uniref:SAM-dependent methyltransferase n=1 Tax=Roseospira goensis TaxID=391922 RepID=A0A7W6WKN0_9PROT|nr:class I SAM-dependent methyltransferase [Roseospira goensis]MBB4285944.1 SAM-dependent methyltransferase [Roseospira goensis]